MTDAEIQEAARALARGLIADGAELDETNRSQLRHALIRSGQWAGSFSGIVLTDRELGRIVDEALRIVDERHGRRQSERG